jgi:hypothetical protein
MDQCPATTQVTPPRSLEMFGLQCQFAKGHDGDHCATATWSFALGDVFWPQETMAGDAASDEDRIRDAMTEAQDHPGRTITR